MISNNLQREILENVGAGKGYLSTVNLVRDSNVENDFIVKTPIIAPSKILASPIKMERFQKMHNTEVDVYRILSNHPSSHIAHPMIYSSQKIVDFTDSQNAHIAMEHFGNCQHTFVSNNLKPDDLIEPLKNLAKIHSLGAKMTEEERRIVPTNMITGWFGELFCDLNMAQFMQVWENHLAQFLSEEAKEGLKLLPDVLSVKNLEKFNNDCQINGTEEVLCHGDYWPANLLFEVLPNGKRKFKATCDFQTSNMGNGAQDLTRLFITGLSGKDRRENTERLLKVYHDELVRVTGEELSFAEIVKNYNKFFPLHAAVMCVPTPGKIVTDLSEITDEDEKTKLRDLMIEKYGSALEDLKTLWK